MWKCGGTSDLLQVVQTRINTSLESAKGCRGPRAERAMPGCARNGWDVLRFRVRLLPNSAGRGGGRRIQRCMEHLRHFCIAVKKVLRGFPEIPVPVSAVWPKWEARGAIQGAGRWRGLSLFFVYIRAYNDVFTKVLCTVFSL